MAVCVCLAPPSLIIYLNMTVFSAFSHRHVSLGFLSIFHFLLGSFSFISLIMPCYLTLCLRVTKRSRRGSRECPCLWQICVIHAILTGHDYYHQDWLWKIYDLENLSRFLQIGNTQRITHGRLIRARTNLDELLIKGK